MEKKAFGIPSQWDQNLYAGLRSISGFMFMWHGSRKIFDFPASLHSPALWVVIIGGSIQLIIGSCIMVGWGTRSAAFLACGVMAVAYWVKFIVTATPPIENHGEMVVLYCFVFLYLSSAGNGCWSIGNYLDRRRI